MSGIELIIPIVAIGSSIVTFITGVAYNVKKARSQKKKHLEIMDVVNAIKNQLQPKENTPEPTPKEEYNVKEPYGEIISNHEDYEELKPYFNKKTGQTEYFYTVPQSARPSNVPVLNLKR